MFKRFLNFIINHPLLVVILVAGATVFLSIPIPDVDFSASSDTLMVPNDPDRQFFNRVKDIFGDDQISVIAVIADDTIYKRKTFETIKWMTEKLEDIEGVDDVVSIVNIRNIVGRQTEAYGIVMNELDTGKLIKEIPSTPEGWVELKKLINENPLYSQNIVSDDELASAINVVLETISEEELYERDIVGQIERIMAEGRKTGLDISATGIPQTKVETSAYMKADLQKFMPYTILLIAITLYISFHEGKRRFHPALLFVIAVAVSGIIIQTTMDIDLPFIPALLGTAALVLFLSCFGGQAILLPLLAVILAVVWTVGFMAYLDIKFSLVTTVLPSLLIAIGIAYVIHVMSEYYMELSKGKEMKQALIDSVEHISLPVVVTGFTTMVGFASLTISSIPAIRDMGILAVFGVFSALVLSLAFIPSMISLIGLQPAKDQAVAENEEVGEGWLTPALRRLGEWDLKFAPYILGVTAIVAAYMVPQIRSIQVDTDFMSYFDEDDPIIQARNKLIAHLAGSAPFFVIVDGHVEDIFLEFRMLEKLEKFEKWVVQQEGVDIAISAVEYLKLTNRAQWSNDSEHYLIPDNRRAIAQLYQSLSGTDMLDPYMSPDKSMANIMIRTTLVGSHATKELERKVNQWAAENFPEATVTMTGTLHLLNKTADKVSRSQTKSISLAIFVIFLLMSLLFLSFKFGALSMVPNIFPVFVLFGTMGVFNITLNLSTSIIASIIIGIAVDDTIHFLAQFNFNIKTIREEKESIMATMATTGRPIAFTTATLCMGFAVVGFSKFQPISHFGLLTAFTLFMCLVGDLVVLPAILRYVKIITLWDLLDVKLGKDPNKKIKIFEGLSIRQARIAALMGHITAYSNEDTVIEEGDVGSEMFVVITGKVEIYSGDWDDRTSIAILGPGDNFGEMALVRHGYRSASVRALESTELLILDDHCLERINKRYPRIAAAIFLNLTRILSDRLQITTVTAMLRGK